MLEVEEKKKP